MRQERLLERWSGAGRDASKRALFKIIGIDENSGV